jgi:hypothetical protein
LSLLTTDAEQTLFIESFVDDERILHDNAINVKISSPDVGFTKGTLFYPFPPVTDRSHSLLEWIPR